MVQRGYSAGFRLATKAKDDEERVLQLDPNYVDAKLVAGYTSTWWARCHGPSSSHRLRWDYRIEDAWP